VLIVRTIINRRGNTINVEDAHAGVVIEADAQPSFGNDYCLKASNLYRLLTQKTPSPRRLIFLGPTQTAMKNLNLNSGLMV
jgi:hypothetical protein